MYEQHEVDIIERKVVDDARTVRYFKYWKICLELGIAIPLVLFIIARASNEREGGSADAAAWGDCEGEEGEKWWKYWCANEEGSNDENGDENGNGQNGYYDDNGDWNEYQQEDEAADEQGSNDQVAWWWRWQEAREREGQDGTYGLMIFLWVWTVFVVLALFCNIKKKFIQGKLRSVQWTLVVFANYCLLCAIIIGNVPDLIEGEGNEEIGFYGQFSVMTFLSCIIEMIVCIVFACWVRKLVQWQREAVEREAEDTLKPSSSSRSRGETEHPYSFF